MGDNAKNIDDQLQMPKIPIVEDKCFKELEDWVVVSVLNPDPDLRLNLIPYVIPFGFLGKNHCSKT